MWHFPEGYVIIQIEGLSAARFLKRIADAGIRVSDVTRIDAGTLRCTVPAKRFKQLRKLRRGLRLRVHIVRRGGFPFAVRKLWRRPFLWVGVSALLIGMLFVSSRIWVIRIDETARIDPAEITDMLGSYGIRPGARPEGPVLITAANDMSARIHDAAWIGLDREGIVLHVHVVESIPESPKKTTRVPSDVIAEKDGTVLSVSVMRGQARVRVGDRVKAGDVLISGTVFYKDESYETSADGVVTAAVRYEAESGIPDFVKEAKETDNTQSVRILRFASYEIMRTKPTFTHYRLTDGKAVSASDLLPVTLETLTAREIVFSDRDLTPEEAEQLALSNAREKAYALVPKDAAILNTYGTFRTRNGERIAVAIVTAEETIGKTEEIQHDG